MESNAVSRLNRRNFIRASLATLAAPAVARMGVSGAAAQQVRPEAKNLTHYQEAEIGGKEHGPTIFLRWNNEALVTYRAQPQQKYPYFYPLMGPVTGLPLTSESGLPWPHHRSLWFACDQVNGHNFWQSGLEHGRVLSTGPKVASPTANSAVIEDACAWTPRDKPPVMTDRRRFTITVVSPRLWTLDADILWKAETDVSIPKTNHALFAIRCAPDIAPDGGGNLVSSEGASGEAATLGKPARWCAFFGKRLRAKDEPVEGIALFEHPQNPWKDCPWFTRNYGNISPMPFNWLAQPWTLPAGETVRLRYRVAAFAGDPKEAQLDDLHKAWVAATAG